MWTIADLAKEIAQSLTDGASDGDPLRLVRQFLMDRKGAMVETPPAFANRGVFIRRASLVNV